MKKIIRFFCVMIFVTCCFSQTLVAKTIDGVEKINDELYVGKKGDLYFAFERVNSKNINFWKKYAQKQKQALGPITDEADVREWSRAVSLASFTRSLEHAKKDHVWIAYASIKPIKKSAQEMPLAKSGDIEMAVTVMTNDTIPFTTHLGIFRAVEFAQKKSKKHKGISMDLHSFAAKSAIQHYGNKQYMITKPMDNMRDIMLKNIPRESVCLGSSDDFYFFKEQKQQVDIFNRALRIFTKDKEQDLGKIDWKRYEQYFPGVSSNNKSDKWLRIESLRVMKRHLQENEEDVISQFNLLFPRGDLSIEPCFRVTKSNKRHFMDFPNLKGKSKFKMPIFYNTDDLFKATGLITVMINLKDLAGFLTLDTPPKRPYKKRKIGEIYSKNIKDGNEQKK